MSRRQINVTRNPRVLLKTSATQSFHFLVTAGGLAHGWVLMLVFQTSLLATPQHSVMLLRPQHPGSGRHAQSRGPPACRGAGFPQPGPSSPSELPLLSRSARRGAATGSELQGCFPEGYLGVPRPYQPEAKPITICRNRD